MFENCQQDLQFTCVKKRRGKKRRKEKKEERERDRERERSLTYVCPHRGNAVTELKRMQDSVCVCVCECVCVCVCVFVVRFFFFFIILYVNCFCRTMFYMCIEYHI